MLSCICSLDLLWLKRDVRSLLRRCDHFYGEPEMLGDDLDGRRHPERMYPEHDLP
jgi:hypothetical protein